MLERLQEAKDFAITNGLLKYNTRYELTHAPFSLVPYQVSRKTLDRMIALTPLFNELMLKVGRDGDFLTEHLEGVARTDDFVRDLLALYVKSETVQPCQLMISRNDYMLSGKGDALSELRPKQVEFNTISNSFVFLSRQTYRLHRYLYDGHPHESELAFNDPLEEVVDAMAQAISHYDYPQSCLLMVVQSREQNVFDQRAIEYRLLEKHSIPTLRLSLEEVAENGVLKEGHLTIRNRVAALTYFRAAYTPEDFVDPEAWKGRRLIEASSSIKIPSIGLQLAGAKKIQQVLGRPEILRRFATEEEVVRIADTFVGLHTLDEKVGDASADRIACRFPGDYVLKPQREGGGNNLYDSEMVERLQSLDGDQRQAYILMERIQSPAHASLLVVEGVAADVSCLSEVGRYGVCFADGERILLNRDMGYLVRTKSADQNEGGVCAGYACLNSLRVVP
ncbi:MAG: glutathione synthase [Proteobacteria bacterium]|nr:glutathione synthase [Pseudomonadota bacterium]